MLQSPFYATFNDYEELRAVNQQDTHYFGTLEYDSYEDVDNLINTCVEFLCFS